MTFARSVFILAGVWGIAVLTPLFFLVVMIPAFIEKAGYIIATAVLYSRGRISSADASTAIPDSLLLVLFVVAFVKTRVPAPSDL